MGFDDLGKMCDNDRYRIDERISEKLCLDLLLLAYPFRLAFMESYSEMIPKAGSMVSIPSITSSFSEGARPR